jgi:hypothetical protein
MKAKQAIDRVVEAFSSPINEVAGCIVLGDPSAVAKHRESFPDDPTGLEAFVNHVHVADLVAEVDVDHAFLRRLGTELIRVWAERMQSLLKGREVLFYLTGRAPSDMTVRFHVDRSDGRAWLNLEDTEFLVREDAMVYRGGIHGLSLVAPK